MIIEIKVPSPGESITEVEIGSWLVSDGDIVEKDQEIAEIESDKATLSLIASEAGAVNIKAEEGDSIEVGAVACTIDTDKAGEAPAKPKEEPKAEEKKEAPVKEKKPEAETKKPEPPKTEKKSETPKSSGDDVSHVKTTPAAKAVMEAEGLSVEEVLEGLRRLSRKDVETAADALKNHPAMQKPEASREEDRQTMSSLRKKLSQRLVSVKNETAMLTTFNELDMTNVMQLRKTYQERFVEKHGFKLGFMSFFTKAVSEALKQHPGVNSMIEGDEIVTPRYHDVGIAVMTPKGLMVPIVRNVETKSIPEIELEIKELAAKARNRKLTIEEMTGGTFTITNGGVFGSLMSTPIINPPQSGILGMHAIKERPIAVNGKVEIRSMMYTALSYDHRVIDGKDSVGFLVHLKEFIENPEKLLFGGSSPEELLLDL
ncbi:2-oxoglutarate dehydrogenase complex dihydrolipoyllysine-residue succinyltransferase [Prolixibacter sp. NT017]|uniref:2-oxoglutarate dehydrogenase complex dihydrolipoyllysine-residue succinyltransferase n=1 Tax=Prolixibacter sp. NT017 TaxID=2652390 RepID=UPI001283D619|nr:2-oxoglutarate dehydrogenase complex dihydrolipoyllysine-residue succinyltransferase [Prolixibacter sp. NT017]GET24841.1 dihydrolipoyllysine-residue succinyltransferase component of 2-oxoglutarate dehydrogenase complex [Prolixibacter sp. NT017]